MRGLVPKVKKKKATLKADLSEAVAVGICVDIWTSKDNRGFLGISIHYIDSECRLRNHVLACPRFTGKHEASKILQLTTAIIDEYQIRNKIFYVGVDNGANMLKAFREMKAFSSQSAADDDDGNKHSVSNKYRGNLVRLLHHLLYWEGGDDLII